MSVFRVLPAQFKYPFPKIGTDPSNTVSSEFTETAKALTALNRWFSIVFEPTENGIIVTATNGWSFTPERPFAIGQAYDLVFNNQALLTVVLFGDNSYVQLGKDFPKMELPGFLEDLNRE